MAIEAKRGCGYRKVGGLYLEGGSIPIECDRLPFLLDTCPVCGGGIKLGRGFTRINPLKLFGLHDPGDEGICKDNLRPCLVCDPVDEVAFVMLVGEKFYPRPQDFLNEAVIMGVSKKVAFIPRELEVGKTMIFLAHLRACEVKEPVGVQQAMAILDGSDHETPRLLDAERVKKVPGVFSAFIPTIISMLVWKSKLKGKSGRELRESLEKRGITPVPIPDGDRDHAPGGGGSNNVDEE